MPFGDCSSVQKCQTNVAEGGCQCNNSCECDSVCDKCSNNVNRPTAEPGICECNNRCQCITTATQSLATIWWNGSILEVVRRDYSGLPDRQPDQAGPTATSRALAMVHVAMYDAYVGWTGERPTYLRYGDDAPIVRGRVGPRRRQARAAIAAAAFTAMSALYPNAANTAFLIRQRDTFSATLPNNANFRAAADWGTLAAQRMLEDRDGDGSEVGDQFRAGEPRVFDEMHVVVRSLLRELLRLPHTV